MILRSLKKHMPESNITLSSIIKFSKEPTVKHIADEVIDLDYENGLLVLLKKDKLETNRIDCSSILLKDDRFLSVSISGGLVLVTGGTICCHCRHRSVWNSARAGFKGGRALLCPISICWNSQETVSKYSTAGV